MAADDVEITFITCHAVSLRQGDQMQMPVWFPQILDAANFAGNAGDPVVQRLAELKRCVDTGFEVAVPGRRIAELHVLQREDINSPLCQPVRRRDIVAGIDPDTVIHPQAGRRPAQVRRRHLAGTG